VNTIEFAGANLVISAPQNPYEPCFLLLRRSHRVQQEDPSPDAASLNEYCSHAGRTPSLGSRLALSTLRIVVPLTGDLHQTLHAPTMTQTRQPHTEWHPECT